MNESVVSFCRMFYLAAKIVQAERKSKSELVRRFVFPRRSLSYEKIVQAERKSKFGLV